MSEAECDAAKLLKMLLGRFRVAKHADMGDCLVIPEDRFEPDWDDCLTQVTEVHGVGGYVFVKLPKEMVPKKAEGPPEKRREANLTVEKLKPQTVGQTEQVRGPDWTPEEERLLIEVAKDEGLTMPEICAEYLLRKPADIPSRSESAVFNRVSKLRSEGKLPHVKHSRGRKAKRKSTHEEATRPSVHEEAVRTQKQVDSSSKCEALDSTQGAIYLDSRIKSGLSYVLFDGAVLEAKIRREDLAAWKALWRELQK